MNLFFTIPTAFSNLKFQIISTLVLLIILHTPGIEEILLGEDV